MREPPCLSKIPTEKIQISSRLTSITNLLVKNMDLKQRSLKHFITQKDQIIFPLRRATWPTLFSSQEKGNHLKTICWVGGGQTDWQTQRYRRRHGVYLYYLYQKQKQGLHLLPTLSLRLLFSLRSFSSTSMFSIPESTSTWDMLQVQKTSKSLPFINPVS